jgi:pimeloyl-ACP methyl ester carboxylesterase
MRHPAASQRAGCARCSRFAVTPARPAGVKSSCDGVSSIDSLNFVGTKSYRAGRSAVPQKGIGVFAMIEKIIQDNVLLGFQNQERKNHRAVLFVHGFTGDWKATWRHENADLSFLELITRDPELADFDVFSFSYRATFLSAPSIADVAVQLHQAISLSLAGYQLTLVGHSMGGLVCMRYILDRLEHNDSLPLGGLLMYGTPTTGTELVQVARILSFAIGSAVPWLGRILSFFLGKHAQLGELGTASAFLQKMHDGWALRVVNGGDPELNNTARASIPVRVVTGVEDWVVPKYSAKSVYGEIDWHPLNYSHVRLVKPTASNDPRYLVASQFFQKCRDSKNSEVLSRLRAISDSVWRERERQLIRNWEFDLELNGADDGVEQTLRDAGYTACEAKKCSCTLVLRDDKLLFGITLDEMEGNRLWARDPHYLHQLVPSSVNEQDRQRYLHAFEGILGKFQHDLGQAWNVFFPAFSARVRGAPQNAFSLIPGATERVGRGLLRKFTLPANAVHLLGEEVLLDLQYSSVVPGSGTSFFVVFSSLTHGFRGRLRIDQSIDHSLSLISGLQGEKQLKVVPDASNGELDFRATGLVLPRSWLEFRWHHHNLETDLRAFLGSQVPHIQAGHRIAANTYEDIRRFVRELKSFRDDQKDSLLVQENYVINDLLYLIANSLPPQSIWLGVSHLTTGWQESDADPQYRQFVDKIQERARRGQLKVMRLYCIASEKELEDIRGHLEEECAAGIMVRTLIGDHIPRDMSLLWLASDSQNLALQASEGRPVRHLRDSEVKPICGMEFHTWQRRSLNKMSLYSPPSGDFNLLAQEFDDYWKHGKVFEAAELSKLQGPHTGEPRHTTAS